MTNEYGNKLDRNGYAPSIVEKVSDQECFCCHRSVGKLDRHEVFHGALRTKSKSLGLWVTLCHGHHMQLHQKGFEDLDRHLRCTAQMSAMFYYDWSKEEFIKRFGKNYL